MKTADGKERLIRAARELLTEQGYQATSPRDIQRRGEAGQGSFYHHFESKRDLAAAALDSLLEEMSAELEKRFAGDGPPLEKIRAWLKAPRDAMRGCRLGRLAHEETVIADDLLRAAPARYFELVENRLRDSLEKARKRGDIRKDVVPREIASMLFAIIQGGYVLARTTGDGDALSRALRGALRVLDGLEN